MSYIYLNVNIGVYLDTILKSANQSEEISLRNVSSINSTLGGQRYTRCHCKTNRCACRSTSRFLNSKYHESLSCKNKQE